MDHISFSFFLSSLFDFALFCPLFFVQSIRYITHHALKIILRNVHHLSFNLIIKILIYAVDLFVMGQVQFSIHLI